jgi:biopolymer transport protein ExbB
MSRGRGLAALLAACTIAAPVLAQDVAPATPPVAATAPGALDRLLEQVRAGNQRQREEDARRIAEFRAAKDRQAALLAKAIAAKNAAEARSAALEKEFDANEAAIPDLQEQLKQRMGALGELFGVARQVSGDALGMVGESLVSAQIPGRDEMLRDIANTKELPSEAQLRQLWFLIQQEMTESGKIVRFQAPLVGADGQTRQREVTRIGTFNVVADGRYLQWVPETKRFVELPRQPAGRYLRQLAKLETADEGVVDVPIDPSRGNLLGLLIQTPSFRERVDQGGLVGYIIIALGLFGLWLALYRLLYLYRVGRAVRAQIGHAEACADNPLGRVLRVYERHAHSDVETLGLKLDEAILKETPALERGNALIKVLTAVGPLLGLLGTVTGMVRTFQVITLFGTGDPKLMAGGISEALVTTVEGLTMAIPLLLLHSVLSARTNALVHVLDEQAAGFVAARAEQEAKEGRHALAS